MTGTACPVCGSANVSQIRPAEISRVENVAFNYSFSPTSNRTFRLNRCSTCTHQFCAPLPEGIEDSYSAVVDQEYMKHARSRRLSADAVIGLVERYVRQGRLLDVGCATGDFLAAAQAHGYFCSGLEPSRWSSDLARERGLTVHNEKLAAHARTHANSYDVVSLLGVIEHFVAPRAEIADVVNLLRPGGLVVIWTGDVGSIEACALGRKWWNWQGQHIQYFTRKSLLWLTADSGLVHVRTTSFPWAATIETVSNSLRRYRARRLLTAVARLVFNVWPVVYLRLPGELLFLARRPDRT